jgi:hypothetical protein
MSSFGFGVNNDRTQKVGNVPPLQIKQTPTPEVNIQCDTCMSKEEIQTIREFSLKDSIWKYATITIYITVATSFLITTSIFHEVKKSFIIPLLSGVALATAAGTWLRNMLSMNMIKKDKIRPRISGLSLYILSGMCFLASSLAVMERDAIMQYISSLMGSVIAWQAFLITFQGQYKFPTKQQFAALLQILFLSLLWETRTFIVNLHFT